MSSSQKLLQEILKGLASQGGKVEDKKSGYMIKFPNGFMLTLHKTPSDHRALKNERSRVRRAGYHWPLDHDEEE